MDRESNVNDYFINIVSDFAKLKNSYVEEKNNLKKLQNFITLLTEELRIARDAERTADFKKSCSQNFVVQQQEVINKLLGVKEENLSLKQSMKQLQATQNDLVNKYKADQEKRDSETEQMKNNHVREILLIKDNADEEVLKAKKEPEATLNSLNKRCIDLKMQVDFIKGEKEEAINTTNIKFQEKITKLTDIVMALQTENKELKERSATNIAIFQKKLSEQERQHQAELETWKRAEINRALPPPNISFKPQHVQMPPIYPNNVMNQQYVTNPMTLYQNQSFYQTNHKPPLNVSMSKKALSSYQTANDLYKQNQKEEVGSEVIEIDNMVVEDNKNEQHLLNITVNKSKPKYPAAVKKRKLYSASDSDWSI